MRHLNYVIGGIATLLFASCGQQHQAKEVIQEFIDQHVTETSARSSVNIVKLDSTRVLNDSIILRMRADADTIRRYQKPVRYVEGGISKKLFLARITYTINDVEYSDTYYLDEQLTRVVAFKSN